MNVCPSAFFRLVSFPVSFVARVGQVTTAVTELHACMAACASCCKCCLMLASVTLAVVVSIAMAATWARKEKKKKRKKKRGREEKKLNKKDWALHVSTNFTSFFVSFAQPDFLILVILPLSLSFSFCFYQILPAFLHFAALFIFVWFTFSLSFPCFHLIFYLK